MDSVSVLVICFPKQLKADEKMHTRRTRGNQAVWKKIAS